MRGGEGERGREGEGETIIKTLKETSRHLKQLF